MNDDAFPHQGFPSGWYQVAWAGELEVGAVQPLRYFSRDLVLYRGADGEHHLLDAFCPHMGAHLGYGGCVEGDNIVCPYHGWTWAPDGHNVIVPSEGQADRPSTDRHVDHRGRQRHRVDMVRRFRRAPWWPAPSDQPGVAEGLRHDVHPNCSRVWRNVRMRPQYVAENNVDIDHLHWIHRAEGPIDLLSFGPDDHCFRTCSRIIYGYGRPSTRLTPDGPITVDVTAEIWGLGFQYTFFPEPDQAVSIQAQTPVDDHHCDMFQSVLVYCEPGVRTIGCADRQGEGQSPRTARPDRARHSDLGEHALPTQRRPDPPGSQADGRSPAMVGTVLSTRRGRAAMTPWR